MALMLRGAFIETTRSRGVVRITHITGLRTFELPIDSEHTLWIRGWHEDDSPELLALRAAWALR